MNAYELWLQDNHLGAVRRRESLAGGCISDVSRLYLSGGPSLIVKTQAQAAGNIFWAEAESLQALAAVEAIRIPEVIHACEDFLLLEDLGSQSPGPGFHESLGAQLAALHSHHQPLFGFSLDNYCGATPQNNQTDPDGFRFFGERRLLALALQAHARNLLSSAELKQVESIATHLEQ